MLLLSRLIRSAERVSASNGLAAQAAGESSKVLQGFKELQIFQRSLPLKPFSTSPARASNLGPSASQHGFASTGEVRARVIASFQKAVRGYATVAPSLSSTRQQLASATAAGAPQAISAGLSRGSQKQLAVWLGGCTAWVFSMVVLGGLTRLTRSGLSMTDWKLSGERPPCSQVQWEEEFQKYQQSPEYKRVNRSMALEEFKFIYWMEYAHRMWGRVLGLAFAGPAVYFAARGQVNRPLAKRLGLLFLMGGTQGFVGWWMVRSGLEDPKNTTDVPRVSPYRLAAHLGSAFLVYSILLWTSLSLAFPQPAAQDAINAAAASGLRKWVLPLSGLLAITGMSGAFVAGLDAGHAYNTFPLMGGKLVPEEYWSIPSWRNAFENTAAVQFHHRLLALTTLSSVAATWLAHRRSQLPGASRHLLRGLVAVTALQVTLGITTLLTYVPPSLGAAHQATALALFSIALALLHSLRPGIHQTGPAMQLATPTAALAVLAVGAVVIQKT